MLHWQRMSDRTKALLAIVGVSLLWSSAGIAKIAIRALDPLTVVFLRFLVASIVILPFFLIEKRKTHIQWRILLPLSLLSGLNAALYYIGLQTSSANAATIVYAGTPLITSLLAKRFIAEETHMKKLFGLFVGLAGVLMIIMLPAIETGQRISGDVRGNLFYLLAVIVWAVYTTGSKKISTSVQQSPIILSSISIFMSCALFAAITGFTWKPYYAQVLIQPSIWLVIVHLGVFVTAITLLLYQWTIKLSSATTASLTTYLQPVFSVVFNMMFLGEQLTAGFILGGIVVITGVAIATGGPLIREIRHWKMLRGA